MSHLSRDLRLIYLSNLFFSLGMGLYTMILPAHIRSLGAGAVELGTLGSLAMLVSTLSYVPGGYITDRVDRKWLMIGGWAMCIPAPIFYATARTWQGVIPGHLFFYLSMFSNLALQAYIFDSAPKDKVSFVYTLVFSAFSMGSIFSQVIGGLLTRVMPVRYIFWMAAFFYTISTLVFFFLTPNRPHTQHGQSSRGRLRSALNSRLVVLTLVFSLVHITLQIPTSFVVPFLQDRAATDLFWISTLGSLSSLAAALIGPTFGGLADRLGRWRVLALGLGCLAFAYLIQVLWPVLPVLIISFVIRGAVPVLTLMTSQIGQIAPPEARGLSLAIYACTTGLFASIGPSVGGWLYAANPAFPFIATVAMALTLGAALLLWQRRQPQSATNEVNEA
ncbi:MAG: MFS transporter [Bacillota bacterium]